MGVCLYIRVRRWSDLNILAPIRGAHHKKEGGWDSCLLHNMNEHTGGSYRRDPPPQPLHVQAAAAALAGMSMGKKEVGVDVCRMFDVPSIYDQRRFVCWPNPTQS